MLEYDMGHTKQQHHGVRRRTTLIRGLVEVFEMADAYTFFHYEIPAMKL